MIQVGTKLKVRDNSGILLIKCIGVKKKTKKSIANIGDLILASIRKKRGNKIKSNKKLYRALVINLRRKTKRLDGSYITFNKNNSIVLSDMNKPIGTRILAPISKEVYKNKLHDFQYVISKAPRIL